VHGLLLINLGTPESPHTGPVRDYLAEFLADPRVLTLPAPMRWFLLYFIILPFRPRRSAAAYQKVWDAERGSPLLFHTRDLADAVDAAMGADWVVALGMRYGNPSLESALDQLIEAGCERIFVMPLYPQYASSTTGSTLEAIHALAGARQWVPPLTVIPPFYDHPAYLQATLAAAADTLADTDQPHVVFSFHGIPESHVQATDLSPGRDHCLASESCCDTIGLANRACYRAQCVATARLLAERLELPADRWSFSFQSRLGRVPWLQPYTDHHLEALSKAGTDPVVVLTPSFVADCLETLEEIGMEAKAEYTGGALTVAPCLNAHPDWVSAVVRIVHEAAGSNVEAAR